MADDTPDDTPIAPQFPGQTYRDAHRSASPNTDDSDSGPKSKSSPLPTSISIALNRPQCLPR